MIRLGRQQIYMTSLPLHTPLRWQICQNFDPFPLQNADVLKMTIFFILPKQCSIRNDNFSNSG